MVIGATETTDAAILTTASRLYTKHGLKRVYYSGFSPIPFSDARLPVHRVPLVREHRLYQADWLMRFYGFASSELTGVKHENLSLERDPKLDWALRNRDRFPVDVNRASREELLRVPGFGVQNVQRIIKIRRFAQLRLEDLGRLRISLNKAKPFIVAADHNPAVLKLDRINLASQFQQMSLFESTFASVTGEI